MWPLLVQWPWLGCAWRLDLMILEPFPTIIIPLFSPGFTYFLFCLSPFIFFFAMPHFCPVVSFYRLFIYSLGNFGYHDEFYFSCQAVRFNPNLSVGAWTWMDLGSFIPPPSFHHSFLHQPSRGHPLIPTTLTLQTQKLKRIGEKSFLEDFWLFQILCPVCIVSFSWNVFLNVHLSCSCGEAEGLTSSEGMERSWHQSCGKSF